MLPKKFIYPISFIQAPCKTVSTMYTLFYKIGYSYFRELSFTSVFFFFFIAFNNLGIFPVGSAVQLGTNLHFIVPEGNCALPLTLIPTTMSVQRTPQPSPSVQFSQTPHPPQPANYTPAKVCFALYSTSLSVFFTLFYWLFFFCSLFVGLKVACNDISPYLF